MIVLETDSVYPTTLPSPNNQHSRVKKMSSTEVNFNEVGDLAAQAFVEAAGDAAAALEQS